MLVVDDDRALGQLIVEALDASGFSSELVCSVAAARKRVPAVRPDVILLDMQLPVEDGWCFLRSRQADARLASIPVVAMSAAPEIRGLPAQALGADAFLSKPFDFDELSRVVRGCASQVARTASSWQRRVTSG